MSKREINIYMARLFLRESRARNSNPAQRDFCFRLLQWAQARRVKAAEKPMQRELFQQQESA